MWRAGTPCRAQRAGRAQRSAHLPRVSNPPVSPSQACAGTVLSCFVSVRVWGVVSRVYRSGAMVVRFPMSAFLFIKPPSNVTHKCWFVPVPAPPFLSVSPYHAVLQNAVCVDLFPLPLAQPGFYPGSFDEFASCVPAAACPGVDADTVAEAFSRPAARGVLR